MKESSMTLNEIVTRAASVYPDCWVLQYWDMDKQYAVSNKDGGDTLAQFIAWELYETFDAECTDQQPIDTAVRKMRDAAGELQAVVTALENLKQERRRQCPGTR
jgi:hypothetical protein